VLAGPQFPNGIVTHLKYTPGETSFPTTPFDPGTGTSSGTTFTPGTSGTAGTSGAEATGTGTGTPTDGSTPTPTTASEPTSADAEVESMPAYMWLALLVGLIGFFLVRSMLLESVAGIRPDGVLARIKALTPPTPDATQSGPLSGMLAGMGTLGRGLRSAGGGVLRKLPFVGKKG
jgi:hypothetical protein